MAQIIKRKLMKSILITMLVSISCLAATKAGQTQDPQPHGPISLEVGRSEPARSTYTLRLLQVNGTKPTQYVWFLQKQVAVPWDEPIEPNETCFRSLYSVALRDYVSHMPAGTHIIHSPIMHPSPNPAIKVNNDFEPGIQDFVSFCRSKNIDFKFGTSF